MPKIDLSRTLPQARIPELPSPYFGKVRDCYDLPDGTRLLISSDRISAFDRILAVIPWKGQVLTQLARHWFEKTEDIAANHVISYPDPNVVLGKKLTILPVEVVVRGYLAGSGWKEYQKSQTVCGLALPAGLAESAALPEPIFTPSTKAATGHDENISFAAAAAILGADHARQVRDLSLKIYAFARDFARQRGIIIADTKFEFGLFDGQLLLIDEVLTPDSSRFWPADQYQSGKDQPSFDKQYVRNYLESQPWDKTPPAPTLPDEVVKGTRKRYLEAYELLTGRELAL